VSLNKCMIIGNLGRDPEMRYTPSGQAVTQFTVAVNRNYRDSNNEWQEETEWFRVVVWREAAERAAERLRKGSKVYVEGRLQTRQWEDREGQKRYTTELIAQTVTPLDPRSRDEETAEGPFPPRPSRPSVPDEGAAEGDGGRGGRRESQGQPAESDYTDLDDLPF
jgi:single-strand DNA-binding protein